jgi:hypothetical protein
MLNAEAPREDEAARREPRLRDSLRNSDLQETQLSFPEVTLFTGFTAAPVTVRIFAVAIREDQTFCDPKSP